MNASPLVLNKLCQRASTHNTTDTTSFRIELRIIVVTMRGQGFQSFIIILSYFFSTKAHSFGSFDSPNISRILFSIHNCSSHLIFYNLSFDNHGLSETTTLHPYQLSRLNNNKQVNQTKKRFPAPKLRRFCRFLVFYSKQKLITSPQLGKLLQHFVFDHRSSSNHLLYIVLLEGGGISYLNQESRNDELIYPLVNHGTVAHKLPILPNFGVLNLDEIQFCVQSPKGVAPLPQNFFVKPASMTTLQIYLHPPKLATLSQFS